MLIPAIGIFAYLLFFSDKPAMPPVAVTPTVQADAFVPTKTARRAQTLDDLLALPVEELTEVDIAEMNLLCATGLPGAESVDVDHCLAMLDQWAARVAAETERHLYRVNDPRWAERYRNSEAYLRAVMLLQVLQEDLGIKYDMTAVDNFAFSDSRAAFLHGMIPASGQTIADTSGGTCASMPVMYVAVGRRLGYPLKLVRTDSHIFIRWDGLDHSNPAWQERFNIEGAGQGFSSYDDAHYKSWPVKLTDKQVRENRYLLSLTPAEEFAEFLAARGHCATDNGKLAFAARCYENAVRYDTARPYYRAWFLEATLQSGYRPVTPALAQLLEQRKRAIAAATPRPRGNSMDIPMPSQVGAGMHEAPSSPLLDTNRDSWQPMMPAVPEPNAP